MTLQTRAVELLAHQQPPALKDVVEGLAEIRSLTQGARAEMRALIFQLRPEVLHEEGLVSAIRRQAAAIEARDGIRVSVKGPDPLPLAPASEIELYRMMSEALANVMKHASAQHVAIRVAPVGDDSRDLMIEVSDDGEGFEPEAPHAGCLGLVSMRERISQLGGTLEISSAPGGTTVRAWVPQAIHSSKEPGSCKERHER